MPATIVMASAKLSPKLPPTPKPSSTLLSSSTPSSSPSASSPQSSVSTISIPVKAFHDRNTNVITITPYIFLKTETVAKQMQALRQDKKIGKPPEQPSGALRVKRRTDLSKLGLPDAKPASVSRRNARERNRVKQVNLGFETLREHVPNGKKNKKMSKVQTLRSAAQYIKDLYMILHGELPELGSPNVVDEQEPNSPLDTSVCSMSDNDNDISVGSPESSIQQQEQQQLQHLEPQQQITLESTAAPSSPVMSVFSHRVQQSLEQQPQIEQQQQRQHQQPSIMKKESVSVLQQQLNSGQLPPLNRSIPNTSENQQLLQQQLQQLQQQLGHQQPQRHQSQLPQQLQHQPQQQQSQLQQQLQHQPQQQQSQMQQQLQPQELQQSQLQQQLQQQHIQPHQAEQPNFDPSTLNVTNLTCPAGLGFSNDKKVNSLAAATSALTFTELSPVSLTDEQCESYMDLSPEQTITGLPVDPNTMTTNINNNNNNMDSSTPSSLMTSYINDVNMNVVESSSTDFNALQSYYKSVHNEHLKSIDRDFIFQPRLSNNNDNNKGNNNYNFLEGQNSNLVHSPAPSLSSTTSTSSSDADGCVNNSYDYENYDHLDKEALLDISNWISELCRQDTHPNDFGHSQYATMASSH